MAIASIGESIDPVSVMWRDAALRLGVQQRALHGQHFQWGIGGRLDVTADTFHVSAAGTGTAGMAANVPGSLRLQTGATSSSSVFVQTTNAGFVPRLDNRKFYLKTRVKFVGLDAQTTSAVCLIRAGGLMTSFGAYGANSTVNIVAQCDGLLTGAFTALHAHDAAWHDYEMWTLGDTKVRYAVDGVDAAVITPTLPVDQIAMLYMQVANGTTGANRELYQRYVFWATPEEAT